MKTTSIKAGDLLVAEPFMDDPNFQRSVVLITENDETGTLGLVLNKPSLFYVNEVIADFPAFKAKIYMGGPVGLDRVNFIHSYPDLISGSMHLAGNLYWNGNFEDLKRNIEEGNIQPNNIKFFIGFSGWGIGQLEDEMQEKTWIVSKDYRNIFKSSDMMWKDVLEKMGGKYKIIANSPTDPSLN